MVRQHDLKSGMFAAGRQRPSSVQPLSFALAPGSQLRLSVAVNVLQTPPSSSPAAGSAAAM
jgi:hypothetical protein